MKKTIISSISGTILIATAIILLGTFYDWWSVDLGLYGALGMVLIVPSVIWMFFGNINVVNSMMYSAGLGYILYQQGFIGKTNLLGGILSLIVFSIGMYFIGQSFVPESSKSIFNRKADQINRSLVNVKSTFRKKHVVTEYDGIKEYNISSKFTTIGVDLSKSEFEKNSIINIKAIFGNVELMLSDNVIVNLSEESLYEKIKITRKNPDKKAPITQINASTIFGKILLIPDKKEDLLTKSDYKALKKERRLLIAGQNKILEEEIKQKKADKLIAKKNKLDRKAKKIIGDENK